MITLSPRPASAEQSRRFIARADKQTNQQTLAYTPTGWGATHLDALSRCVGEIRRFPYEGDEHRPRGAMDVDESQIPADS